MEERKRGKKTLVRRRILISCQTRTGPVQDSTFYIYIYAFSRRFYPKRLTIAFRLYIFISTCVPWESNPQPFAQLTQSSTTEPHRNTYSIFVPLFQLKVPPRLGGPPICPGPYASAYLAFTDATPLACR